MKTRMKTRMGNFAASRAEQITEEREEAEKGGNAQKSGLSRYLLGPHGDRDQTRDALLRHARTILPSDSRIKRKGEQVELFSGASGTIDTTTGVIAGFERKERDTMMYLFYTHISFAQNG